MCQKKQQTQRDFADWHIYNIQHTKQFTKSHGNDDAFYSLYVVTSHATPTTTKERKKKQRGAYKTKTEIITNNNKKKTAANKIKTFYDADWNGRSVHNMDSIHDINFIEDWIQYPQLNLADHGWFNSLPFDFIIFDGDNDDDMTTSEKNMHTHEHSLWMKYIMMYVCVCVDWLNKMNKKQNANRRRLLSMRERERENATSQGYSANCTKYTHGSVASGPYFDLICTRIYWKKKYSKPSSRSNRWQYLNNKICYGFITWIALRYIKLHTTSFKCHWPQKERTLYAYSRVSAILSSSLLYIRSCPVRWVELLGSIDFFLVRPQVE